MINKIILSQDQLVIVKNILQAHVPFRTKVWVFGSRAKGNARLYSDLDLVVDLGEPLSLEIQSTLNDAFDESNLPFKVDIVDWQSINESFRDNIGDDRIPLIFTS